MWRYLQFLWETPNRGLGTCVDVGNFKRKRRNDPILSVSWAANAAYVGRFNSYVPMIRNQMQRLHVQRGINTDFGILSFTLIAVFLQCDASAELTLIFSWGRFASFCTGEPLPGPPGLPRAVVHT